MEARVPVLQIAEAPVPTPIDWSSLIAALGGGSVVAAILSFWKNTGVSEAQLSERWASMKAEISRGAELIAKGDKEFKETMRDTVAEMRAVVITVAKLQSSQDVLNAITTKTLESFTRRFEDYDHRLTELETTQGLIRELLDALKEGKRPS